MSASFISFPFEFCREFRRVVCVPDDLDRITFVECVRLDKLEVDSRLSARFDADHVRSDFLADAVLDDLKDYLLRHGCCTGLPMMFSLTYLLSDPSIA